MRSANKRFGHRTSLCALRTSGSVTEQACAINEQAVRSPNKPVRFANKRFGHRTSLCAQRTSCSVTEHACAFCEQAASHQIKVGLGHYDRSYAVKLGLLWTKATAMGLAMSHEAGLVIGWRSWETKAGMGAFYVKRNRAYTSGQVRPGQAFRAAKGLRHVHYVAACNGLAMRQVDAAEGYVKHGQQEPLYWGECTHMVVIGRIRHWSSTPCYGPRVNTPLLKHTPGQARNSDLDGPSYLSQPRPSRSDSVTRQPSL